MRPPLLSLPKKVKKQLEALLRSEKNAKQWRRYKAILLCSEKERTSVSETMGIDSRTLRRWIYAFRKKGIVGLQIKKQCGRPTKIPNATRQKIVSVIDSNPHGWSTKQIREIIQKETGVLFSKRHIYRIAQRWGFSEVTPRPRDRRRSESAVYQFKKKQKR